MPSLDKPAIRNALLLRTAMEVLRDAEAPMPSGAVLDGVAGQADPTEFELAKLKGGHIRWVIAVKFITGNAATIGWISKQKLWTITPDGLSALDIYLTADELYAELNRRYNAVNQRRKQAQENLGDVLQFIADTLLLVEAGSWTAHDDLAELAGSTPQAVADLIASAPVRLPNSQRVLNADGSLSPEGMVHATHRIGDLRHRLEDEGLEFDAQGRAGQDYRLDAAALRELIEARRETEPAETGPVRRAWMLRGSNVDGYNLIPQWLSDGFVSLSAGQVSGIDADASYEAIRLAIESGYEHKSYAYRSQRLEEFDRFLRKAHPGDLVLATQQGKVYLGEFTGAAYFTSSDLGLSNLRRKVEWRNVEEPLDAGLLPAPVPALLQSQSYVVELTEAYPQLAGLLPERPEPERKPLPPAEPPVQRKLAFNEITEEFAAGLLLERAELAAIADLLWERRQIVLHGPSGTGKTYLATKLAGHLTDEGSVKLVQFHPSYTYEDFFEGFRPEAGGSGTLTFTLRPGPFRAFADAAAANKTTPYILVIDEINRANLAKVFGELYFLLEYRDQPIGLQYSPKEDFTLPPNLFLIGTMNTADRSIARVDAAMRRRFAFVELHPRRAPVRGLLARWLAERGLPGNAALLLDALNDLMVDADAAIGPSYLMRPEIYRREDGLERVWRHDIMPLLEDLFYGQRDLEERYGLASLRKVIAAGPPGGE